MAKRVVREAPKYLPSDGDHLTKWEDVVDRFGDQEVNLHLHSPKSEALGTRVFSVVTRTQHFDHGRLGDYSVAHVLGGNLRDPYVKMDFGQLEESLNKPGPKNKTRNTFIGGMPTEHPVVGESTPMYIRPGIVRVNDRSILEPYSEPGMFKRRGQKVESPGLIVPRDQPSRSGVFAAGAIAHSGGFTAIDPRNA